MPAPTIAHTVVDMADASIQCAHCSFDVPPGLIEPESEHQFCCNGCKSVWTILHSAGLDGYYAIRDAVDPDAQRPEISAGTYEELDDPAFTATCVEFLPGGQAQTELLLEGMHCAACVWLIERLPRVLDGVVESRANITRRTTTVRYHPEQVKLSQLARALDRLGYASHPARGAAAREARAKEDRRFLVRVGVAGAIAGNVMLLAIALYGGALDGISETWSTTFRWYSMGLGILSLLWPGRVFFTGALAAIRTRTAHLDLPIALALVVGGIWGSYNTIIGTGEIYFDSLSILVFLLLVGRWVQHRQQRSAADQLELMLTLTPSNALKVNTDGSTARVPIEAIEIGMLVEVPAGGSIPADGTIETGQTSLDTSLITGESRPINARVGDQVVAGATNLSSPIRVRVEAVGDSTRVGKLMQLVASASADKPPIVRFADRIAGYFVSVVIVLAIITLIFWTFAADLSTGIELATALLIVTCPCALGLATPMSMSIAMGRAAKAGILVKSSSAIEAMAKPGELILDKTGTITLGQMRVVDSVCDNELQAMAAAIERHTNHPIAAAIIESIEHQVSMIATDIHQTLGSGITGTVAGHQITIGSPTFIESLHPFDASARASIEKMLAQSLTPVVLFAPDLGVGVLGIGDPIRDEARQSIAALNAEGWNLQLCSGDHPQIVEQIAKQVGIEHARGGVSPEAKAELVKSLRSSSKRRVVMVGDGVNDAAALASADVGIAVHGGAEASLEAGDIYLTAHGIAPLVSLVSLAHHTMRTIHIALVFSIGYNALAATLAIVGVINPLIAAIIMPISSLTVVAMSTRRWKGPR
jgi:P-type Cu2+ transporter